MRRLFAFLFSAALLFAQSSKSSKGVHQPPNEQHATKDLPKSNGNAAPATKAPPNQPSADQEKNTTNKPPQYTWWDYLREAFGAAYLSNWCLALIAFGTAIAAIATLRQISTQTRMGRISLNAARRAANAAKESADASVRAADNAQIAAIAAERTMHLTERADILIESISLSNSSSYAESRIIVKIRNFGRTRADKVLYNLVYGIKDCEPPDVHISTETQLGAGGEFVLQSSRTLLETVMHRRWPALMEGKIKLQVWGDTTFRDIFGKIHTLKYRATWRPHTPLFDIEENQSYEIEQGEQPDASTLNK